MGKHHKLEPEPKPYVPPPPDPWHVRVAQWDGWLAIACILVTVVVACAIAWWLM